MGENGEPEYIEDPILLNEEMKKVFIGGISTSAEKEELQSFIEEMSGGTVKDLVIIKKEKKPHHFGFATMSTSAEVDDLLLKRDELKFKDRQLDINRAVPKNNTTPGAHEKTKKLFIANIPKDNCSEEEVKQYFEARHPAQYGTIESVQLIKDKDDKGTKTERNKGFGFVMCSSEDLADKMAIQHSTFDFKDRRIELKKSVPNSDSPGYRGKSARGGGGARGQSNAGGYGGGFGGYGGGYGYPQWGADPYAGGYGGGYDYSGYGGGYGAYGGGMQQQRGRGGRYQPY